MRSQSIRIENIYKIAASAKLPIDNIFTIAKLSDVTINLNFLRQSQSNGTSQIAQSGDISSDISSAGRRIRKQRHYKHLSATSNSCGNLYL